MKKRNLRIQVRMQIFRKISQKALNRVLTVPDYSTRRELSGTTLKIVMVILLQEKNFGPNVIYYVFVTPLKLNREAVFIRRPSLSVVPGPVLKDLFIGFNRKPPITNYDICV